MQGTTLKISRGALVLLLVLSLALMGCQKQSSKNKRITANQPQAHLEVFAGAASKPPLEELAAEFESNTGIKVDLTFGGSGAVLSQMEMAHRGDIYLPGSPDFMERAKRDRAVDAKTERIIAYLIPAINVPKGNPKHITSLEDLAKPGVRVGLARPDTVCVGLYGAEILEKAGLAEQVKKNIATYAESCEKTANLVALRQVDAVIGWDVFSSWAPDKIETIYLHPDKVVRLAYIPAAIASYSQHKNAAAQFIDFITSDEGKRVFKKWGYLVTEQEARKFAPQAQIGGEYQLQTEW